MARETADVVIVGGGCMGTSTALALAERGGGRVVLLEKGELASGATGRSSAILRQHYAFPATARLARQSLEVFRNFDDVVGGDSGYVNTGYVVGVPPEDSATLRDNVAMLRGEGVRTELVTPEDLRRLVPSVNTVDLGLAAYEADSGYADPHATTMAFARAARRHGATIRTQTLVRRLLARAGRVTGVETADSVIEAPVVILAANAWNVALARTVGVELPVGAYLHEICVLDRPADFPGAGHPVYSDLVQIAYFRPEGANLTLVGSGLHEVSAVADPDHCPEAPRATTIDRFAGWAVQRFPALARAAYRGGYAAFYDVSADAQFILDAVPGVAGVYVAVGFSGHGFKHSPLIGRLMADLVLGARGDSTGTDLAFFSLARFTDGGRGHVSPFRYSRPRVTA